MPPLTLILCTSFLLLKPPPCQAFAPGARRSNPCARLPTFANSNSCRKKQSFLLPARSDIYSAQLPEQSTLEEEEEEEEEEEKEASSVQVFDNVFALPACHLIHDLALEHSDRASNCDGSSIFYRNQDGDAVYTPLEQAIDSALTGMGDTSNVVEYWSREEYINIDAHADIDEGGLLEDGDNQLRCPKKGHILYLSVGEGIKGPTFIFPDKLVGWKCGQDADTDGGDGDSSSLRRKKEVEMVIVPAVEGRVVRFDGRAMHAVPKPADRWLLSDVEEQMLREKENNDWGCRSSGEDEDDYEFWEDDEDGEDPNNNEPIDRRSVLLFNTWNYGPSFVDEDPALHMPAGIELSSIDDESSSSGGQQKSDNTIISSWEETYGPNGIKVQCNEQNKWKNVPIKAEGKDESLSNDHSGSSREEVVRVSLMGNKKRRLYPKTNAKLFLAGSSSSADRVRYAATMESRDPTSFILTEEDI